MGRQGRDGQEGTERRGVGAREPHALSRVGEEKLPQSCARSGRSRAVAVVAVVVVAAGGVASGPGRRSGSLLGAQLCPALPGPRPPALGALHSVGLSLPRNFHSESASEPPARSEDAGSTRPARGNARPRSPAPPRARRRLPASEGRCPGRGRDGSPRPSRGRTPKADKQ